MKRPKCVKRGEKARLFPILSETSKEGRTCSIFLATMMAVRELSARLLGSVGQRIGTTAKVHAYTEIEFECAPREKDLGRPDGLIVVDVGKRRWTALIEAKVGRSEIQAEQLNRYLQQAKQNKIDAVITISNQFSSFPQHHPLAKDIRGTKGVELYHWSWMKILTEAELLYRNDEIIDNDQALILNEFRRFISHESSGVQGFDRMPASWTELVKSVQSGASLSRKGPVEEVAEAWQQECRDLCLILSRQLQCEVSQRLSRAASSDPAKRFEEDIANLINHQRLAVSLVIPGAASDLDVVADLKTRNIFISMGLTAPGDKKGNQARLRWLLRQLPSDVDDDVHIRCRWPATSPDTQESAPTWRNDVALIDVGKGKMKCHSFEVVKIVDLGARFGTQKPFIDLLESEVPEFYEEIGQNLRTWTPPAPRITEGRDRAENVSPSAISEDAEGDELILRNEV
ncbi:hypothetical protein [Sphingomicrobium clamense]|uniref:Stress response protein n=1 Tax=Sphingomicrobium clamense TaxID=2851013 RepID=A0ABS6V4V4_9SPHN|nr:hypothetical protein [Sphingomicrobium sp. B8]MBW0144232.1 hypothetical protein [Sphingomicrobium sp. B8]